MNMRISRLSILLAIVAIGVTAVAPAATATPRNGDIHIIKDCTEYAGQAGGFCTITSSNLPAIPAGSRIVYASAAAATTLDTDISIATGPGNVASGHCTLDFLALPGVCTLSGGTGKFNHIHASVMVSPDATTGNVWHWDGTFAFGAGS
jgi:hypothetical protein